MTAGETYTLIGVSHVLGKRLLLPSQKDLSQTDIAFSGSVMRGVRDVFFYGLVVFLGC